MLDEGLIEEVVPEVDQRPERGRRTYRLTGLGSALLEAEALRLRRAVRLAQTRSVLTETETELDGAG
jgi:DNA-binding PadR family transcriptional regulator